MAAPKDFVAFILTHGRADNVKTYAALRKGGYTGDIRLIIDDEDDQADDYFRNFPNEVVQFHKVGVKCDTYDNRKERRVILFARNAAFDIAEQLGYRYFIELDDDYEYFCYRFNKEFQWHQKLMYNLDEVLSTMLEFLKSLPSVKTIAFGQTGDYVGGGNSTRARKITLWRKAMNSFICDTQRRFQFSGRINEDVNTYTTLGSRGELFFTLNLVALKQGTTQHSKGGMTGAYLDGGTYAKSFYTVITMPSAVKIDFMGNKNYRLHHMVDWRRCVPLILPEKVKKQ